MGKKFCGQNLSKKQEWPPLRLKKFQVKCLNFEAITFFHLNLCICMCLSPFTEKASSVWNSWNTRKQINDVVLKTFLFSAKSLLRYFRMKHQIFLTSHFIKLRLRWCVSQIIRPSFTTIRYRPRKPIYLWRQVLSRD